MKYKELESIFQEHEQTDPKYHLDGEITFSSLGDFEEADYTEIDRTYLISSNNKAFRPNMLGYSIFGSCLNGKDPCVRLDHYMRQKEAWVPGECCLLQYQVQCVNERDILQPEVFATRREAVEVMLKDLCKRGELEYEQVLKTYDNQHGFLEEEAFGAENQSAWLNAGHTGNWDWKIQPIRIFSLNCMRVGERSKEEVTV